MEIAVTGRHVQISDRFREHLDEKLAKVPHLAPRLQRLDVVVTHEVNRRQAKECDRVEITGYVKGSVIRAEACADDKYAALDVVADKLFERLRRVHDRSRVHRGRHAPESVAQATARTAAEAGDLMPPDGLRSAEPGAAVGPTAGGPAAEVRIEPVEAGQAAGMPGEARNGSSGITAAEPTDEADSADGLLDLIGAVDSPIEVREKVHATSPMSLDQALYEMELVGHDFYLFHCIHTDRPSVVYRRRGWSYGVIRLAVSPAAENGGGTETDPSKTAADAARPDDRVAASG